MSPRLTDWNIALATGIAFMTGVISLISGHPQEWLIFVLHAIGGFWLLLLMWGKLRRVWPRLVQLRRWDRRTIFGLLALLLVMLAIGSGTWWFTGGDLYFAGFQSFELAYSTGFRGYNNYILAYAGTCQTITQKRHCWKATSHTVQCIAYRRRGALARRAVHRASPEFSGAKQRFTGSREVGSYAGNAFPTSSWVADHPRPIDAYGWRLTLEGAVTTPREFLYHELVSAGDELEATLDCTGGFYSTQRWRGIRVGHLLDEVALDRDAHYVSFVSVTNYRWSLPLEEARNALLATHTGEESLSHEHGFPLRLVAPNRRGFEWVKWITRVEVLTTPDPGQVISIFTSSLTDV